MIKGTFILILSLLVFKNARAQQDTLKYFMKKPRQVVQSRDSADYIMYILQGESSMGKFLYPVREYYFNGKLKLTVESNTQDVNTLSFEGPGIAYFPNGQRKSAYNYKNGYIVGEITAYYLNGQLYTLEKYNDKNNLRFIECRDSSGKVLAENGNGRWIAYNDDFKLASEGPIADSVEGGEWHGMLADSERYVCTYVKGVGMAGVRYDKVGNAFPFDKAEVEPAFEGDVKKFYTFLAHELKYPRVDKENNVQGRVLVSFVVEKDGTLTNVRATMGPDKSLCDEAVRAIKLSPPWVPGQQFGLPVRVQYTIPLTFNLSSQ